MFSKKETGLVPAVLDYLVEKRGEIKKRIKALEPGSEDHVKISARSQALKILSNSFYGYLGYARSRWYSRPCAESVTSWGRKHIMETIEKAEKWGFEVIYGDTDSIFVEYKKKEDILRFMDEINATLPEKMELELEGFFPRGVFVSKKGGEGRGAKKKYALINEDGRIKIRGFELVRRDWSEIAKETQLKVLEAILKEGSKEKAVWGGRETVERLQKGDVPLEMLAISTQLNKDPDNYEVKSPELSAARKMLDAGIPVEKGTMISYVIGKKGKSISEKAVPLELAKEYDTDYYINNQVLPSVMKIMKELGYDEYSLKVGGKQASLDKFF
jgi:DNA polymerase I